MQKDAKVRSGLVKILSCPDIVDQKERAVLHALKASRKANEIRSSKLLVALAARKALFSLSLIYLLAQKRSIICGLNLCLLKDTFENGLCNERKLPRVGGGGVCHPTLELYSHLQLHK